MMRKAWLPIYNRVSAQHEIYVLLTVQWPTWCFSGYFCQDQKSLTILPQISFFALIFKSLNIKNMSEIAQKVKQIIIEKLGVEESEVTPEASFTNDLGADSLDTVELIMEFEKEFNISIPDDQAENISTVGQAISYLEQNVKK
jgi:acyl carrier protein